MATSSPLSELDPLDAFALDALLATDPLPLSSVPIAPASLSGQAALAAFLAEMDAFDHDLIGSTCRASFDLTALPSAGASTAVASTRSDTGARSQPTAPARTTVTRAPSLFDPEPAIPQQQQESDQHVHTKTKEAFSLFAQRTALAFALEPARPLKRKRRIRAKEEIDTLRDTAETLTRDLETLKSRQQQRSENAPPVVTTSISVLTDSDKRGAAAQETNRKLRKTVDAQLQFAGKVNEKLLSHISTERQVCAICLSDERDLPQNL